MLRRTVKLVVYKDRINSVRLIVNETVNGVTTAVDFSGVARMVLVLNPSVSPVTIDSSVNAGTIDYSENGVVVFTIGELAAVIALDEGEYDARLSAVDGAGDVTELVNEDSPDAHVIFVIRDTTSV